MLEGSASRSGAPKLLTRPLVRPLRRAAVDADLSPVGTDRLAGTVTNRLGVPLEDAILAFGKQVYLLGTIAPGATVRVELGATASSRASQVDRSGSRTSTPTTRTSRINRADLLLALMFHDSQSDATQAESAVASNPLHYLDLTGQLALDRPMLVARIDRPAPGWSWATPPALPKIDQTTMLRVILPLDRPSLERSEERNASALTTVDQGACRRVFRQSTQIHPIHPRHQGAAPMIETHDLTKMYGDLYALNRLNLTLHQGDVYGFIGPNGAGKTTTMRILATLLNPTWGEATVCGYSIYTGAKEIRRVIGYMPDFFGVYDDMKVIEYLEFFAPPTGSRGRAAEDLRGGARAGRPDLQARCAW